MYVIMTGNHVVNRTVGWDYIGYEKLFFLVNEGVEFSFFYVSL